MTVTDYKPELQLPNDISLSKVFRIFISRRRKKPPHHLDKLLKLGTGIALEKPNIDFRKC